MGVAESSDINPDTAIKTDTIDDVGKNSSVENGVSENRVSQARSDPDKKPAADIRPHPEGVNTEKGTKSKITGGKALSQLAVLSKESSAIELPCNLPKLKEDSSQQENKSSAVVISSSHKLIETQNLNGQGVEDEPSRMIEMDPHDFSELTNRLPGSTKSNMQATQRAEMLGELERYVSPSDMKSHLVSSSPGGTEAADVPSSNEYTTQKSRAIAKQAQTVAPEASSVVYTKPDEILRNSSVPLANKTPEMKTKNAREYEIPMQSQRLNNLREDKWRKDLKVHNERKTSLSDPKQGNSRAGNALGSHATQLAAKSCDEFDSMHYAVSETKLAREIAPHQSHATHISQLAAKSCDVLHYAVSETKLAGESAPHQYAILEPRNEHMVPGTARKRTLLGSVSDSQVVLSNHEYFTLEPPKKRTSGEEGKEVVGDPVYEAPVYAKVNLKLKRAGKSAQHTSNSSITTDPVQAWDSTSPTRASKTSQIADAHKPPVYAKPNPKMKRAGKSASNSSVPKDPGQENIYDTLEPANKTTENAPGKVTRESNYYDTLEPVHAAANTTTTDMLVDTKPN